MFQAVIAEGILIGELPFLQKYLTQRFGAEKAEWMNIINTGLSETLIFLQEKEMVYAKKMLQNMVRFLRESTGMFNSGVS